MMIEKEKNEEVSVKKRGRRKKNEVRKYELNKNQTRFVIDLKEDNKCLSKIQETLVKANEKDFGREVNFADIVIYLTSKLGDKDIEKIQEGTLSVKDKLMREHRRYEEKIGKKIEFWDYLELNQKK